jgi:hypothetical protein
LIFHIFEIITFSNSAYLNLLKKLSNASIKFTSTKKILKMAGDLIPIPFLIPIVHEIIIVEKLCERDVKAEIHL